VVIDFHTHTLFSDGALVPAEHLVRARVAGYDAVALTDHADHSNLEYILRSQLSFARSVRNAGHEPLPFLIGVELTHNPVGSIADLVAAAVNLGAEIVLVHGETVMEPVPPGTNRAAIDAGVDILAHPGLLTAADAEQAVEQGVCLEITAKRSHSITNGHVASLGRQYGAVFIANSDTHDVGDFFSPSHYENVVRGAGLTAAELAAVYRNAEELFRRVCRRHSLDY
jgi:putative hydrolase